MSRDRFEYEENDGILFGLLFGAIFIGITALVAPALADYLFGDYIRSFFDNDLVPDTITNTLSSMAVMGITSSILGIFGFGWRGVMRSSGIWGALGGLIIVNLIAPEKTFSIGLSFLIIWVLMTIYEKHRYGTPGIPAIPAIWFVIMVVFGLILYFESEGGSFDIESFSHNLLFVYYFIPVFLVVAAPGIGDYGIHFAIVMEIIGIVVWGYMGYKTIFVEEISTEKILDTFFVAVFVLMILLSPLISFMMLRHRDRVELQLNV